MENEKQPIQVEGQPQNQMPTTPPAVKPDNYLVWAILSTVLCCWPLGIVSIIYASKVDLLWAIGQYAAALDAADKAKKWFFGSLGAGVAVGVLAIIYYVVIFGLVMADELSIFGDLF